MVVDPQDYAGVLDSLQAHQGTQLALRQKLAQKAYARRLMTRKFPIGWPPNLTLKHPHFGQLADICSRVCAMAKTRINRPDFMLAGRCARVSPQHSRCKVKNFPTTISMTPMPPLSWSLNLTLPTARPVPSSNTPIRVAWRAVLICRKRLPASRCDPVSAFGGIIAMNRPLDATTAEAITQLFTEVIIAPGADDAARNIIAAKKNLRLLITTGLADRHAEGLSLRTVAGAFWHKTETPVRLRPSI